MHRALLLEKLRNYCPSPEEAAHKDRMIDFIQNNPDCFERTLETGHITASCWLLNKAGTHILLTHHKKLGMWLQLGGHCDGDHDVVRVALKEAQEESGIMHIAPVSADIFDIDIHLIPESKKEKAHYHYDVRFLLQVMSDEEIVISDESHDLRWFSNDAQELPQVDSSVLRMFDKWRMQPAGKDSSCAISYQK